jgi:dTDP-4-dehydrorhamnose reductase
MKVLVTGAEGQVGSEIIKECIKTDIKVLATSRSELDITKKNIVDSFIRKESPDIVINAAAYTQVDKAESEPEIAYAINKEGVINLAEVCSDINVFMMHISTDYIFDGEKKNAYKESCAPNPKGIYGRSKLEGELAIQSILKKYFILRVSWVFGIRGNNFVKTMLRLAKDKEVIKIVADQYGGPTSANSIAVTLVNIIRRGCNGESLPEGIYNYSGLPVTNWYGFADVIFKLAKEKGIIEHLPELIPISTAEYSTQAQRPINSVFDLNKIRKHLNIEASNWYKELDNVLDSFKS